jgi:hypothetical protein
LHTEFKRERGGTTSPVWAMFFQLEKMAHTGHAGQEDVKGRFRTVGERSHHAG